MDYTKKYLKYKQKYLALQKLRGGGEREDLEQELDALNKSLDEQKEGSTENIKRIKDRINQIKTELSDLGTNPSKIKIDNPPATDGQSEFNFKKFMQ